ncbi:MAG: N-acetyltransferase [Actinomycetota bacterium]|nr:N-acetyltransferase [Actinomycetota bacterium]
MPDPTPEVRHDQSAHRFEIVVDGSVAGFAEYSLDGDGITFTHTVIDDEFEGMGFGGTLAATALDDARERGLRVTPTCSFIADYIERHPAYADLVDPS